MGGSICGLVQPPAPPQRDQIRDAPPAPQWSRHGHLPAASGGLRGRPPCQSNALERCHPLLESAGRSVDKQATGRARTGPGVTIYSGRLNGSQGVTTFLKVTGPGEKTKKTVVGVGTESSGCEISGVQCQNKYITSTPAFWFSPKCNRQAFSQLLSKIKWIKINSKIQETFFTGEPNSSAFSPQFFPHHFNSADQGHKPNIIMFEEIASFPRLEIV